MYQMRMQVVGGVSSPSSCQYVIRRILQNHPEFCDLRSKKEENMFVNNYLDSFEREQDAINTSGYLTQLLRLRGFLLNQWTSSSWALLTSIPRSAWNQPQLNLDLDPLPPRNDAGGVVRRRTHKCAPMREGHIWIQKLSKPTAGDKDVLLSFSSMRCILSLGIPGTSYPEDQGYRTRKMENETPMGPEAGQQYSRTVEEVG